MHYINQVIYPKKNIQSPIIETKQQNKENIFILKNEDCIINKCNLSNIDEKKFDNLLNKNYTSIDNKFINEIIKIFNNKIKNKIIKLLQDKGETNLVKELNNIDIEPGYLSAIKLLKNKKEYTNIIKNSLCKINKYNIEDKQQFAKILSDVLCEIKVCINNENSFEKIKKFVYDNINSLFNECKTD